MANDRRCGPTGGPSNHKRTRPVGCSASPHCIAFEIVVPYLGYQTAQVPLAWLHVGPIGPRLTTVMSHDSEQPALVHRGEVSTPPGWLDRVGGYLDVLGLMRPSRGATTATVEPFRAPAGLLWLYPILKRAWRRPGGAYVSVWWPNGEPPHSNHTFTSVVPTALERSDAVWATALLDPSRLPVRARRPVEEEAWYKLAEQAEELARSHTRLGVAVALSIPERTLRSYRARYQAHRASQAASSALGRPPVAESALDAFVQRGGRLHRETG